MYHVLPSHSSARWTASTANFLYLTAIFYANLLLVYTTGLQNDVVNVSEKCAAWYQSETLDDKAVNMTFFTYPPLNYSSPDGIYRHDYRLGIYQCYNYSWSRANVSGYYQVVQPQVSLYDWTNPIVNASWWDHFYESPNTSDYTYWPDWGFYHSNKSNFFCNTRSDEYQVRQFHDPSRMSTDLSQWGFSYEWLFVVSIVNSVWIIGLWILWLDCDTNSEFCRKGRRLRL